MRVLVTGLPIVLIAAGLAFGLWTRRGGLNDLAARRRPDGYETKLWPSRPLGWVLLVVSGALLIALLVALIKARGALDAIAMFVVIGSGTYLVSRWMRGARARL